MAAIMQKQILQGSHVRLEPLNESHLPGLAAAIADGALWTIAETLVPHPDALDSFLQQATTASASGRELAFAIIDCASGQVAGSTRFRCIEQLHRRAEIGFTFLGARWQRTALNSEAKFLMLEHGFEQCGLNRIELLTDMRNARSRAAILRLGAREEGVLRSHMVMRDGHVRDSVVYSVIATEWPSLKQALQLRMQSYPSV